MSRSIIIPILVLTLIATTGINRIVSKKERPCLILGATLHVNGPKGQIIKNGALAWKNEHITMVADARVIRIDLSKYHVTHMNDYNIFPLYRLPSFEVTSLSKWGISKEQWKKALKKKNKLKPENKASFFISGKGKNLNPEKVKYIFIDGNKFSLNSN